MLKRQRSISSASTYSSSSTSSPHGSSSSPSTSTRPSASPASKLSRLPPSLAPSFTCSLPPTCDTHPPTFDSAQEVESHYRKLHSLVCECEVDAEAGAVADGKGKERAHRRRCGAIFPEQHLMDLHFAEFHDSVRAVQRDQGQRTYGCYLPSCDKKSHTPKGRRLHAIDVHGFPKSYFFPVVKEGIGPLLRTQGPAASLLRPDYDPSAPVPPQFTLTAVSSVERPSLKAAPVVAPKTNSDGSATTAPGSPSSRDAPPHLVAPPPQQESDSIINGLTSSLASASLAFVPRSVGARAKGKSKSSGTAV